RSAPVLHHRDHVARLEGVEHLAQIRDVARQRVPAWVSRLVAPAEADVVRDDHAMLFRQLADELTVEKAPRRVAVEQEKRDLRVAWPLVDDCLPDAGIDLDEPALPREAAAEVRLDVEARIDAHAFTLAHPTDVRHLAP